MLPKRSSRCFHDGWGSDTQPGSLTTTLTDTNRRDRAAGVAAHTLVEHALCPLDADASLQPGVLHTYRYAYTDKHLGSRDQIGNKGGSLSNRLRAVMR